MSKSKKEEEATADNRSFDDEAAMADRKARAAREMAEIDAIVAKRVKKVDIDVPLVSYPASCSTLRKVYISNKDYDHLDGTIKGTKYGLCERPDIEIHVVGVGAKKPKKLKKKKGLSKEEKKAEMEKYKLQPKDLSGGNGVEFMFDKAKKLWIFCDRQEDRLLLLLQNDPAKGLVVNSCTTRNDAFEQSLVEPMQQKIWRRFCLLHLLPLLKVPKRMEELTLRFIKEQQGGGDKSAGNDEGDEEGDENKDDA